jgi:hypothetical protein
MVGAVPKLDPQIAALSHQWIFRKCGNLRIRCLRTKSCFLICGFGIRGPNSFVDLKLPQGHKRGQTFYKRCSILFVLW